MGLVSVTAQEDRQLTHIALMDRTIKLHARNQVMWSFAGQKLFAPQYVRHYLLWHGQSI